MRTLSDAFFVAVAEAEEPVTVTEVPEPESELEPEVPEGVESTALVATAPAAAVLLSIAVGCAEAVEMQPRIQLSYAALSAEVPLPWVQADEQSAMGLTPTPSETQLDWQVESLSGPILLSVS